MRAAFVRVLTELARKDPRIVLMTADLGFTVFEAFAEEFPDRFYNVGVAEQNMIGMATGLAEAGFLPFVYSIVTFATLRPYEFIRNGPILHQFPVRIVGMGGGLEYGTAGFSHHGLEDIGVMRIQPGLTVIAPADSQQTETAIRTTYDLPKPIYYRLGKNDKAIVPQLDGQFELGRVQVIHEGNDLLILSMGAITVEASQAVTQLTALGTHCALGVIASVNPSPVDDLVNLLKRFPAVMTVEAHYVAGGIGSLVAEVIAEHGLSCRLVRCGVRELPEPRTGSSDYLQRHYGLDVDSLVAAAQRVLLHT